MVHAILLTIRHILSEVVLRIIRGYTGPSVEAVLDRLPTAEIVGERDGEYEIRAEVFGKGIEAWLRSQGAYVQMKNPK